MHLKILILIKLLAEDANLVNLQLEQVRLRSLLYYRRLLKILAGLDSESLQGLVPAFQTEFV